MQVLKAITAASITVIERSEQALELATSLGADHTVHLTDDEDAVQEVLEITGGASLVFDFVGEQGAERMSPRMLRNGGSHYVIGYRGANDNPNIVRLAGK